MQVQRALWATEAMPHRLRVAIEQVHDLGVDTFDLTVSMSGTKGPDVVWVLAQRLTGPHALQVACAIIEACSIRMEGPNWGTKPRQQSQEKWESHLHTF